MIVSIGIGWKIETGLDGKGNFRRTCVASCNGGTRTIVTNTRIGGKSKLVGKRITGCVVQYLGQISFSIRRERSVASIVNVTLGRTSRERLINFIQYVLEKIGIGSKVSCIWKRELWMYGWIHGSKYIIQ